MGEKMLALVGGAGPDWEAREMDVPTVGAGQVLIRVSAAGLNRANCRRPREHPGETRARHRRRNRGRYQ